MSQTVVLNLAFPLFCHARLYPSRTALVVDQHEYTYGRLVSESRRVADWVRAKATSGGRSPRIGILAARTLEAYAAVLGVAWAGGTYVPLSPKQPVARLRSILERAHCDAMIVDRRGLLCLNDLISVLPAEVLVAAEDPGQFERHITVWDNLTISPGSNSPVPVSPDHPAYVMFTSGTTGTPKGVVVTVANMAHFLAFSRFLYQFGPEDRFGQFCELTFDPSGFEMFACWDGGGSVHVVPESKLMAPGGFIQEHGLTVWTSVPSVISLMARMNQLKSGAYPSLRISFFMGEGLSTRLAELWQKAAPRSTVDNQYGPTEVTICCLFQRLTVPARETPQRGTLAIGTPYPGIHAATVEQDGTFLEPGKIGELALSGPQVAAGYLDDPELTSHRFPVLQHPQLGTGRWYRTGDLAFGDPDGTFHHIGRVDNQVKVRGNRVELEEVEAHLRLICGTDAVAAVAWPVAEGTVLGIVAFVCGGELAPAGIRQTLRQRVPNYMVPAKILLVESLPLSPNGKVDRRRMQELLDEGSPDESP